MPASPKEKDFCRRGVVLAAVFAFLLQLLLAAVTVKYPYDASCFRAWAMRMADVGPRAFYETGYFCDYPPGYLLLLWLPGKLLNALPTAGDKVYQVILAFWPALAGAGITLEIYRIGKRFQPPETAARVAVFAAFCPAILYDTGVWGQIDSVFSLLLLCCFAHLEKKQYACAALFYGLSLTIKPQALLVGPVLAICYLWPILLETEKMRAVKQAVAGVVLAVAPVLVCGLPFWGFSGLAGGLWDKYGTTASSYPYAVINACNFFAFLGGEWVSQEQSILPMGGLTWQQLGTLFILAITVFLAVWAWRAQKAGRFSPMLCAALYGIGIFTLSHRMHERYLIFAIVLLLGAAARWRDKRLLSLAAGFSLTSLLNMALVFGMVGTEHEYLDDAVSRYMQRGVGFAETALFALLLYAAWQLAVEGRQALLPAGNARPTAEPSLFGKRAAKASAREMPVPQTSWAEAPQAQPAWQCREKLLLLGLCAAVSLLSFFYLGSFTAPQKCLDENGTAASFTIVPSGQTAEVWVYTGISSDNAGHLTITSAESSVVADADLNWGTSFNWYSYPTSPSASYTVTLTDGQIFEMACFDAAGSQLPLLCSESGIADEQTKVPQTISQLNTFYFDEIYHARTGYELLHGMTVYETTHPPLGKDLIALGIALFGMTGFGWRFAGTLFGVLLVPLLYCFVRRLTRRPWLAAFSAGLFSLDFMRFSQSRLATIDTYAVFFILLAVYGMVCYGQKALTSGVKAAWKPMLLSGAAFGLACASKWTGIYAGAGLAILYFGVLAVRWQQLCREKGPAAGKQAFWPEFWAAIGGGVLCFVCVPLLIYLASYAPYWLRDHTFGLADWWACQKYMYWYHSTLNATHPFQSNWYSWLLDLRPVWYYSNGRLPAGQYGSIAGFVSPVVALAGLAAWLRVTQRQLVGEGSRAGGVLIVALLSSLLPWVMVTRCTFLYHYFPCLPFLIAALALELAGLQQRNAAAARRVALILMGAAVVLFVWFYPALSGLPVGGGWAASLQWLKSWGFYILS